MYHQHHHSCYCVDGEIKGGDAILPSRPDALLANGGAFLPSPPLLSSYYYSQPPSHFPPHMSSSQLQATIPLSPTSSGGMASSLSIRDPAEEEQRAAAPARYSAEERRERIDKYRSKRNQRNFQKKITYACRKTLADSRPRVKGRFARNGGDYMEADVDAGHHVPAAAAAAAAHQSESESPATEWWPAAAAAVQDELPAGIILAELCDDDEMLAWSLLHQYS